MTETAELILKQFPGKAMISMVTAGSCIGLAKQTCYNMFNRNEFPIPVRKIGRKNMVALTDIIKFLEGPTIETERASTEKVVNLYEASSLPRRVGRPTKAEQVRRMRGGI